MGAHYRFADARLRTTFPELPAAVAARANREEHARLHRARVHALYHHPCGIFARAETEWFAQHNTGYATALPGDNFFQHNLYVGYRFPRRRAEILLGVLNLADQDYRLNPLNLYNELPRERVFLARLKLDF